MRPRWHPLGGTRVCESRVARVRCAPFCARGLPLEPTWQTRKCVSLPRHFAISFATSALRCDLRFNSALRHVAGRHRHSAPSPRPTQHDVPTAHRHFAPARLFANFASSAVLPGSPAFASLAVSPASPGSPGSPVRPRPARPRFRSACVHVSLSRAPRTSSASASAAPWLPPPLHAPAARALPSSLRTQRWSSELRPPPRGPHEAGEAASVRQCWACDVHAPRGRGS